MLLIILTVIKTGISWRKAYLLKCCICNPSTVYRVFQKLCRENIIKDTYLGLLNQYFKKTPAKKLECKIVDSTVIPNKYGIDKVAYNTHYGRKRVTKISVVSDINGIPIDILIASGNEHIKIYISTKYIFLMSLIFEMYFVHLKMSMIQIFLKDN